jgi:hypothetical protein
MATLRLPEGQLTPFPHFAVRLSCHRVGLCRRNRPTVSALRIPSWRLFLSLPFAYMISLQKVPFSRKSANNSLIFRPCFFIFGVFAVRSYIGFRGLLINYGTPYFKWQMETTLPLKWLGWHHVFMLKGLAGQQD